LHALKYNLNSNPLVTGRKNWSTVATFLPHRFRANQEVKEKFIKLYQELKGMEPKEAVDRFLFEAQKHRNWFNLRFAGFNKPPTKKLCQPLSIQIDQDGDSSIRHSATRCQSSSGGRKSTTSVVMQPRLLCGSKTPPRN
jgi:hypothetical protein